MKRLLMLVLISSFLCFPVDSGYAGETQNKAVVTADGAETVEPGTETEAERSKIYMKIGEVTVTEKAYLPTADVPASVDVVGKDQIEMENVDTSAELMKKIPGVYFGDWNQGVISSTFTLRGYDVNTAPPVALIIDGIPSYYSSLNGIDFHPIFPLEIERIELLKGTTDSRYGLNNVAGTTNVHTKQGGNFTKVKLSAGSFDTYDGEIATGYEKGNFSQTYFAGYRSSDGFRDNSDQQKGAFSGKWFYKMDDSQSQIGAIVRYFSMVADAPGYLTEEQSEEDRTQAPSFALSDGGEQENAHASLHYDRQFTDQLAWTLKGYAQTLEKTRWARWSIAGSQTETLIKDAQYGAVSTLTYEQDYTFIKRLKLDWGLDYQYNESTEQRWTSDNRERVGSEARYYDDSIYYWGSYVQADGDVNDWLRLFAALRVDSFDGEMENKLTGTESDMLDLDFLWQPKVGTVITPYHGYNFYANWGRTVQLPGIPDRYGQDTSGNLKSRDLIESKNDGWEVGIKASPFDFLSIRADYWKMVATDEVRKKADGSGDKINVGETEREGWDVSLSVKPHEWFSIWGSYSYVQAVYTEPGPEYADRKGKDIELIPDFTAKLGVDFKHPIGITSSLWMESQGDYYVLTDPENKNKKVGDYSIFNFKAAYKLKKATIGFEIKNLFDQDYYAYAWSLANGFSPGDGRSCYAWVTFEY